MGRGGEGGMKEERKGGTEGGRQTSFKGEGDGDGSEL